MKATKISYFFLSSTSRWNAGIGTTHRMGCRLLDVIEPGLSVTLDKVYSILRVHVCSQHELNCNLSTFYKCIQDFYS